MFPTSPLLTTVLLALTVAGSPLNVRDDAPSGTLPFSLNLNLNGTTLADLDRARAAYFLARGKELDSVNPQDTNATLGTSLDKRQSNVGVMNTAVSYTASVNVGSPGTSYTLLIDTGSSNTWVSYSDSRESICTNLRTRWAPRRRTRRPARARALGNNSM